MKRSTKNRKAFSLAEAMIAMVILAFATSAMILPFSTAGALTQEGAKRTLAATLAADRLEEIQNVSATPPFGFDWVPLFYDNYFEPAGTVRDANGQIFTDGMYSKFARKSTCSSATVGGEDLWWVTVEIRYNSLEVLQISTLIGR